MGRKDTVKEYYRADKTHDADALRAILAEDAELIAPNVVPACTCVGHIPAGDRLSCWRNCEWISAGKITTCQAAPASRHGGIAEKLTRRSQRLSPLPCPSIQPEGTPMTSGTRCGISRMQVAGVGDVSPITILDVVGRGPRSRAIPVWIRPIGHLLALPAYQLALPFRRSGVAPA